MNTTMEAMLPTISSTVRQAWGSVPAQQVILYDVSWETYERLLMEHDGNSSTHFAYDRGTLEIMVLSAQHERDTDILTLLVNVLAEEMETDTASFGSTTFRRRDLARGFEPDACFYFQNEALVRSKNKIDLNIDPPPDLIIEIDITSPSLNKFPIFAALGIPELWRYDGERVSIWKLETHDYHELAESQLLSKVTGAVLTELLEAGRQMKRTAWLRQVRNWARQSH